MYVVPGLLLDAFAHILNHKFTYALHLNTIVRAGGAGGGGGQCSGASCGLHCRQHG